MKKCRFTLIEVLVAMTVFLMGITPLLAVLSAMTEKHLEFEDVNKASNFIEYKMREISDSNAYASVETGRIYGDKLQYGVNVVTKESGLQEITIWVATEGYNYTSHLDYKDYDPDDNEEMLATATFLHRYPIY